MAPPRWNARQWMVVPRGCSRCGCAADGYDPAGLIHGRRPSGQPGGRTLEMMGWRRDPLNLTGTNATLGSDCHFSHHLPPGGTGVEPIGLKSPRRAFAAFEWPIRPCGQAMGMAVWLSASSCPDGWWICPGKKAQGNPSHGRSLAGRHSPPSHDPTIFKPCKCLFCRNGFLSPVDRPSSSPFKSLDSAKSAQD
ncbi:hypothetical protein BO70DRAFT_201127 [Aspergillus heteromorphus CBS 117.55]|uniref:Uncharacterized protein n=1 Tax=Aspergillus heteromorphus CBS 117.55 TaxID=1448321 RepID=A0A317WMV4_9EURO|nr:uncharacterized protein BO70DRAFT_201127 [Aspergillus heteromorphus CBS 117.55]PWY87719.1 hypothetical protein BO70DRAFT_201127 [Aspergillus heteromorphus CBS 117.55]